MNGTNAQIKEIAQRWLLENIDEDKWPEDDWTSLTDDFDLNIYIDGDEKKRATIFPVIDGNTQLDTWIEVR